MHGDQGINPLMAMLATGMLDLGIQCQHPVCAMSPTTILGCTVALSVYQALSASSRPRLCSRGSFPSHWWRENSYAQAPLGLAR